MTSLNKDGERNALSLVHAGKVDSESAWSFSAEDGDKLLGTNGDDWATYEKYHLGIDTSAAEKTKERFKYPYGKDGKVYRAAVRAIRSRASQNGDTDVFDAAGRIMDALNEKEKESDTSQQSAPAETITRAAPAIDMRKFDRVMAAAEKAAAEGGKRKRPAGMIVREVAVVPASLDMNAREFDVVISTGAPVLRTDWWTGEDYIERLEISPQAIRMQRLNDGAPFLDSHDYWSGLEAMLGAIVPGSARIDGGELIGRVRLARSDAGDQQLKNVQDGILRKVSAGYMTHKFQQDDTTSPPTRTATDWEPYEVSGVTMPADPDASIRSQHRENERAQPARTEQTMDKTTTAPAAGDQAAIESRAKEIAGTQVKDAVKLERERIGAIRALGAKHAMTAELIDQHANGETTVEQFREIVLGELEKRSKANPVDPANPSVTAPAVIPGRQKREWKKGEGASLLVRCVATGKRSGSAPLEVMRAWERDGMAHHPEVARALQASVGSAGGVLIPEVLAGEIIELLRAKSIVRAMNPTIVPMPKGNMSINRLSGGASGGYVGEGQPIIAQQQSTDPVRLSSKKLAILVPISNDLLAYTGNEADTMVRDDMVAAIGQTEDQAFLRGAGTQFTPKGMRYWAPSGNVTAANGTVNLANTNADLTKLVNFLTSTTANTRMLRPGWIFNWKVRNYLYSLLNSNGMYVYRDEMNEGKLFGFPFGVTNNIPSNLYSGTQTEVGLTDFADAVIGDVSGFRIDTSSEASYNTDATTLKSTFSQDETVIRIIEENDFAMRHDSSTAWLTEVGWGN
jgi:HK97 family phage major capsid protein/HK97 family phage prohead protease